MCVFRVCGYVCMCLCACVCVCVYVSQRACAWNVCASLPVLEPFTMKLAVMCALECARTSFRRCVLDVFRVHVARCDTWVQIRYILTQESAHRRSNSLRHVRMHTSTTFIHVHADKSEEGEDADQDDREAGREELGLDATAVESEDEDEHDGSDSDGGDDATGQTAFVRCFTQASISEEDAARAQAAKEATKWRKREVQGLPRTVLFRPGLGGGDIPRAVAEGDEQSIGIDHSVMHRLAAGKHVGAARDQPSGKARKEAKVAAGDGKGNGDGEVKLSALQRGLLPLLANYLDVMYTARTHKMADELRCMFHATAAGSVHARNMRLFYYLAHACACFIHAYINEGRY
jgi:hypothetical protein